MRFIISDVLISLIYFFVFIELRIEKNSRDQDIKNDSKKVSMKTATDVINRIIWDDDLPTEDFIVGYLDRFIGTSDFDSLTALL